ncbi:hypothetical protein FA15DRAFT_671225 [Coprinopsis marcescibilis]|uniref:Uncharacterized protein n=1 Tax=Coprinopsis marcescibilis TaxID=230819 RepID=A0A5C3KQ73_COPMA|nr:hypothetical protein FA15DRAFT_671225 [Coprinopsis marcescibilis]
MPGFRIRNQTKNPHLRVFVSNYTNEAGLTAWFPLASDFSDPVECHWCRSGFELIVIDDEVGGLRRGWYLNCADMEALELTFYGFEKELGIEKK